MLGVIYITIKKAFIYNKILIRDASMDLYRMAMSIASLPMPDYKVNQHSLQDVIDSRCLVGVEGNSGRDIERARQLGLFTCNVCGVDIFAKCEEDARPLVQYLERGGTYGSLEFSRLLGYSEDEISDYQKYLEANNHS